MIKTLHIITGLNTGGAELTLFRLIKYSNNNIKHHIISLSQESNLAKNIKELGTDIYSLNIKENLFNGFYQLRKIVKTIKPDIIQGWMYHGNLISCIARLFIKSKIVWNIRHSLYNFKFEKKPTIFIIYLNKLLSRVPATIIYNSETSMKQHKNYGFHNKKTIVIANGINTDHYHPYLSPNHSNSLYKSIPKKAETNIIGYAARFHKIKGHFILLNAIKLVLEQGITIFCLLSGTHINKKNTELLKKIKEYQLENNVFLLDESNNIPNFMSLISVFCSPSHSESFPNVIAEAMSCSIPCIATNAGDSATIIGKTGFIVNIDSPKELANAIIRFFKMKKSRQQALGNSARNRIIMNYSMSKMINHYKALYHDLAQQKHIY